MKHRHHYKKLTLRRDLNFFQAIACGVGIIVGAGIYVLLGPAAGMAGNAVWISFIISAVLALLTGFSYAELSSMYSKDGSEYIYIKNTFSRKLAFLIAYTILLGSSISAAAVSLGFAGYFSALFNLNNVVLIGSLLIVLMALINLLGVRDSSYMNILLTAMEILGLIFII